MFPRNSEKKGPMIQICICSFVVHYVSVSFTAYATVCLFQRENIVSTDSRSMYIPCYFMEVLEGRAGILTHTSKRGSRNAAHNPVYHTKTCTVIVIMFGEFLCTYIAALMFRFTHTFC